MDRETIKCLRCGKEVNSLIGQGLEGEPNYIQPVCFLCYHIAGGKTLWELNKERKGER